MNYASLPHFNQPSEFYATLPGLRRDLLKGGGGISKVKFSGITWRIRVGLDCGLAQAICDAHRQEQQAGSNAILKDGRKRCVTKVTVQDTAYVVKEFYAPGPWGRWAADARGWLFNAYLETIGLPVPKALAWGQTLFGPGYVVYEWIPGESGYHVMRACCNDTDGFEFIAGQISQLLTHLYTYRFVHEDLKLSNFLITADDLYLVDNDALILDAKITEAVWQRNLRHLTYNSVDPAERRLLDYLNAHKADIIETNG